MKIDPDCLGCRIANGIEPDLNIVYEDKSITCVLDIAPFNEGHMLILPKKHAHDVEELDCELALAVMDASMMLSILLKRVFQPDGITICQNGGKFNDLKHYHVHLIPRYEGDGFAWSNPLHPDGAEKRLRMTRDKLREAMNAGKTG